MGTMKVYGIGRLGVNTDTDPLSLDDQECRKMQNAQQQPIGVLAQRAGFRNFNAVAADDAVLGGVSVPLDNLSAGGVRFFFIGRGPT